MGAGVRTALVAPSLVLFRRGLTRGTTVGTVVYWARGGEAAEKKSVFFYEQSQYVIENKRSGKRTKPNKAKYRSLSATQTLPHQKRAG